MTIGNGSTLRAPQARVAQEPRSKRRVWRRLLAPLCILATILSLMLSACAIRSPVPPVSTVSSACVCWCVSGGGAAQNTTPSKALDVSPPLTADGVVYVVYAIPDATHNPRQDTYALAALRAQDGLPLWRIPATQSTALITAADGVLIVAGLAVGQAVGLRASDGVTLWRASLPVGVGSGSSGVRWLITDQPSSGGVLYAMGNSGAGTVAAFQVADGRILWQTHLQRPPGLPTAVLGLPPVADGANVYVAVSDGSVMALRTDTGAVRWTAFTSSGASQGEWHQPLESDGEEVYVTAYDAGGVETVVRLNAADGANDGVALNVPAYSQALYPTLTAGIFTTLINPRGLPPMSAPAPTLTSYRLSATSDGHLLWSVPVHFDGEFLPTAHDAQTFYVEFAGAPGMITAYRLTDGAAPWRRQALAKDTPMVAGSGDLFETAPGIDDVCRTPLLHQAPQIRALATASGAVVWTRALDATR